MSQNKVLFIVGATATGKSGLAMRVAKEFGGELICADSQTIRRGLDLGTAKPIEQDQLEVPHHMLDIIDPYDRYSVAQFQKAAQAIIADCHNRGVLPIIVGGTGLYIDALYYCYDLSSDPVDDDLEHMSVIELQKLILDNGWELPNNPQNPRHLIGMIRREGQSPKNKQPIDNALIVGMTRSDEVLKERIDIRIEQMFEDGFLQEVQTLLQTHGEPPAKMDAIGYPITMRYLNGEINLDETKSLFKTGDWQYARRQKSWFARNKDISWFKNEVDAIEHIRGQIGN